VWNVGKRTGRFPEEGHEIGAPKRRKETTISSSAEEKMGPDLRTPKITSLQRTCYRKRKKKKESALRKTTREGEFSPLSRRKGEEKIDRFCRHRKKGVSISFDYGCLWPGWEKPDGTRRAATREGEEEGNEDGLSPP